MTDTQYDEAATDAEADALVEDADNTELPADVDVDFDGGSSDEDDEVEFVPGDATTTSEAKPAKVEKKPARGELPEGYVTPVGLAHKLTEAGLGGPDPDDASKNKVVPPQVVYSYIKNAPKDHPFPLETVEDSLGNPRQALRLDAGLQWWRAKNERAATRKQNAAAKAQATADKAAARAEQLAAASTATPAASSEEGGVTEAE